MGLTLHRSFFDSSQKRDAPDARRDAPERHRKELMRIRLELAELKRTGSRQGLAELSSEAGILSMRIKRFEASLRAE